MTTQQGDEMDRNKLKSKNTCIHADTIEQTHYARDTQKHLALKNTLLENYGTNIRHI